MDCLDDFVVYDHLAKPPLAKLGWEVVDVPWRDPNANWHDYAAVVIRSPWDYHLDSDAFLRVIDTITGSRTRLMNSAEIVRWNIDKSYLRDLEKEGLPIVPTQWVLSPSNESLEAAYDFFHVKEIVLKPIVGAGARDTYRLQQGRELPADLFAPYAGKVGMVQPFLPSVVQRGEWSLFYFAGEYSHAVLKTPKPGDFRVQEEYGSCLQSVHPSGPLIDLADKAVERTIAPTLYARVDLVLLDDGTPAIIELELIEPSLYFPYDKESPTRFAKAIDRMLREK